MYYRTEGVLALLALYVGLVQSFCWDVVVAGKEQLEFYDNNGTRTHIEDIPSHKITSLAYDPVHNRVLFANLNDYNKFSISSFNIATRKTIFLVNNNKYAFVQIAYDPATQLLFWTETGSIHPNLILSKPGYTNAVEQNLLVKLDGHEIIYCIALDSCGGYIYWGTESKIERARFDGSDREVVIDEYSQERGGLAIDHQTQKMYWVENLHYPGYYQMSIESADFNGENRRTLHTEKDRRMAHGLSVSKYFIYWRTYETFSQLTKNPPHDKETKKYLLAKYSHPIGMASNYKIEDQTQGTQNCEALKRLLPINSETNDCASLDVSTDVSLLCAHGTKVNGASRCECTHGYIGERCEVSVCHNYCLQGDCSVSAEGQPKCRCKANYSGERCEVNACLEYCSNNGICSLNEESEPVCQCRGGYEGERCNVSVCQNYCFQGDCSVSAEGQPKCSCNAGYSGERCEVNVNNTLKGWRIDMDHAMAKFTDDIKGTLRGLREEMEISIMSKLNASIKFTVSDMKQEMNTLRCSEHEKLKESVHTVAHNVSRLKSPIQFQAVEQKELKERVHTVARHSSDQSQTLVSSRELKVDSLNKQVKSATSQEGAVKT